MADDPRQDMPVPDFRRLFEGAPIGSDIDREIGRIMKRVLIIDDNAAIGEMIGRMLEGGAFQCVTLLSGEDLVGLLQRNRFDLVITDILMPDIEGIEIIREVRRNFPELPIVAMSGGGHSIGIDVLKSAQQLGARAVLPKPFTRKDLMAAVEQAFSGSSVRASR